MNSVCNKILRPIDGSCCQTLPPPNLLQKLSAVFFLGSALTLLVLHVLGYNHHRRPVPPDVESLEEKKPTTAAVPLGPKAPFQALCRMGIIMGYFYLCDRADVFMKEQKFYTHSTFFIPLIYIFVLGVFYSENTKEVRQGVLFKHKIKSSAFSLGVTKISFSSSRMSSCVNVVWSSKVSLEFNKPFNCMEIQIKKALLEFLDK